MEPLTRTTKLIFALIGLLLVLFIGGLSAVSVIQGVQLNQKQAQLVGSQNATQRLLRQYCNSINAYQATTGKAYTGSTCDQATADANSIADAGATGPMGPQGRGIKDIVCDASGHWRVQYTDNTWSTINGSSCKTTS